MAEPDIDPIKTSPSGLAMQDMPNPANMTHAQSGSASAPIFNLNEGIVVRAMKVHASRIHRAMLIFAVFIGLTVSVYFIIADGDLSLLNIAISMSTTTVSALLVSVFILALTDFLVYPVIARRQFRQAKGLQDDMQLWWNDTGFILQSGKSRTDMSFSSLHGYHAAPDLILLYLSDAMYHLLPVFAFAKPEAREVFLAQLTSAGVKAR